MESGNGSGSDGHGDRMRIGMDRVMVVGEERSDSDHGFEHQIYRNQTDGDHQSDGQSV